MSWRGIKEGIGTVADLLGIGVFIGGPGIFFAIWLRHHQVPAWWLVVAVTVGLVLVAVLATFLFGRRRASRGSEGQLQRQLDTLERNLKVAGSYISQTDDFLWGIRHAIAVGGRRPGEGLQSIEKLRPLVFGAVVQGINSTRDEHVRCVYFEPVDEDGVTRLHAKHHHGHSHRVEKLRLEADHRSVAGAVFASGDPLYIEDATTDPRVEQVPGGREIGSLLCVPALAYEPGNRCIGVFSVASSRVRAFSRADREFASVCASLLVLIDSCAASFDAEVGRQRDAATGGNSGA